jgi:hypothetical protein
MQYEDITIQKGAITITIEPKEVLFNDGRRQPLWQRNLGGGRLLLVKDSDNQLKFSHTVVGAGHTAISYDVSGLDPSVTHKIAASWSISAGEIVLFVDGDRVASAEM